MNSFNWRGYLGCYLYPLGSKHMQINLSAKLTSLLQSKSKGSKPQIQDNVIPDDT